ncbi:MAG: hypothetical protein LBK41_07325 [Clostridiales bacterium]|nr:hypothetical protein [Clostridiales bacterium]
MAVISGAVSVCPFMVASMSIVPRVSMPTIAEMSIPTLRMRAADFSLDVYTYK